MEMELKPFSQKISDRIQCETFSQARIHDKLLNYNFEQGPKYVFGTWIQNHSYSIQVPTDQKIKQYEIRYVCF